MPKTTGSYLVLPLCGFFPFFAVDKRDLTTSVSEVVKVKHRRAPGANPLASLSKSLSSSICVSKYVPPVS